LCKKIPKPLNLLFKPICEIVFKLGLKPVLEGIEQCWPYGAQVLGSPMIKEGVSVAEAEEAGVPYRYMDGAYVDNTAIPMTLAKAQRDCEQGLYDCSEPIKVILVNHGNITMDHQGPATFNWTNNPPLRSLFADPARQIGTFVPGLMNTVNVPVQTIFEEAFPEKPEWKEYLTFPSKRKLHATCLVDCKWVDDPIRSLTWDGTLTTVENKWFGVKAGTKVQFLVFSLEVQAFIWPAMGNMDATAWPSPGHLLFAFGGIFEGSDWIAGHAPFAKAQNEAVGPVLEAFLNSPSEIAYV